MGDLGSDEARQLPPVLLATTKHLLYDLGRLLLAYVARLHKIPHDLLGAVLGQLGDP